jgi:hypothetical protein
VSREDRPDGSFTLARYKRLILLGKISLPLEEARRIVGPDCAYHLYFRHAGDGEATIGDGSRARPIRRAARRRHK